MLRSCYLGLCFCGLLCAAAGAEHGASGSQTTAKWLAAWSDPGVELRPMQIVHGVAPSRATPEAMADLKSAGLGGIVCNVTSSEYMRSAAKWDTLIAAVDACRQAGLLVWIYDEEGYPSGSSGGLVLKAEPGLEAMELVYDRSDNERLTLRPAYEHTHASNNFHAARRYPNLLEPAAVRSFLKITHEAYRQRLGPLFGSTVQAFFTDEPSLIAVDLGQLGESVRKNVRVVDPLDDKVRPLPSAPWCADLPARYQQRYGQDLMPLRRSLFEGTAEADRLVRRRFWALIADLLAERYFGAIQDWCRPHRVASSGHILWEEYLLHHVPLYGNALKMLGRMDIPGLDELSSEPSTVLHGGWMAATLPTSAALFRNGPRVNSHGGRVMTEISDFSERLAGKPPVSLAKMQATAAWQAALGVTEFRSYYGPLAKVASGDTDPANREICRAYCDYVGRLNAVLRDAQLSPDVLLYYPIHDLWAEYLPVAGPLTRESQSPRAQGIIRSFERLGQRMLTAQISFAIADHELLSDAEVREGGLWVRGRRFRAIVLPADVDLPEPAAGIIARFGAAGGKIMRDGDAAAPADMSRLVNMQSSGRLQPAGDRIVIGRFEREGREILLLVNVGDEPYTGRCRVDRARRWSLADPASGRVKPAGSDQGEVALALPAHSAVLLIAQP